MLTMLNNTRLDSWKGNSSHFDWGPEESGTFLLKLELSPAKVSIFKVAEKMISYLLFIGFGCQERKESAVFSVFCLSLPFSGLKPGSLCWSLSLIHLGTCLLSLQQRQCPFYNWLFSSKAFQKRFIPLEHYTHSVSLYLPTLLFFRFVCKNSGVLFENQLLQIGLRSEFRQNLGKSFAFLSSLLPISILSLLFPISRSICPYYLNGLLQRDQNCTQFSGSGLTEV